MRLFFLAILGFAATGASAKQVEVLCTAKGYSCYNSPGEGYVCRWNPLQGEFPTRIRMYRDPNYPKEGVPYEIYHAFHQTERDRHVLRMNMQFRVFDRAPTEIASIQATLDAGSVIAEATGTERIDISLRNNTYGRGFTCSSFRVYD